MPIPLYLKTDARMPRPDDPEFYWLTQDGAFLCRNHPFFTSDVPTRRPIRALAPHQPSCLVRYPLVRISTLEFIVGFFGRVYELHRSESVVLLLWDMDAQRYRVLVPEQTATVWRSWDGARSPLDVRYQVPMLPPRHLLVGDIHCHGNMAAFSSSTDRADERYRDGIHGIVGRIDEEPPQFHLELAIDGYRFALDKDHVFQGYTKRRRFVPRKWLNQVKVELDSWAHSSSPARSSSLRPWWDS
jgi:hypothetical protein